MNVPLLLHPPYPLPLLLESAQKTTLLSIPVKIKVPPNQTGKTVLVKKTFLHLKLNKV